MQEANLRTHHGDDFIPGFHGMRGGSFGSTIQTGAGYVLFAFFAAF
jgi:hypothetical protein